jgi:hypothetical protein
MEAYYQPKLFMCSSFEDQILFQYNFFNVGPKRAHFYLAEYNGRVQTFRRGHIWRVGDGRSIDIWMDHWV